MMFFAETTIYERRVSTHGYDTVNLLGLQFNDIQDLNIIRTDNIVFVNVTLTKTDAEKSYTISLFLKSILLLLHFLLLNLLVLLFQRE